MDGKALKAEMILKGVQANKVAEALGISKSCFYRKVKGVSVFTQLEIMKIRELLGLDNEKMIQIFFVEKVS